MGTLDPSEDEGSAKKSKGSKKKASKQLTEDGVLRPLKLSEGELYKAPTVEELTQLKEAESLFHCSLLKMQVRTAFTCFQMLFFTFKSRICSKNAYAQRRSAIRSRF